MVGKRNINSSHACKRHNQPVKCNLKSRVDLMNGAKNNPNQKMIFEGGNGANKPRTTTTKKPTSTSKKPTAVAAKKPAADVATKKADVAKKHVAAATKKADVPVAGKKKADVAMAAKKAAVVKNVNSRDRGDFVKETGESGSGQEQRCCCFH
jgi:membrane protein involved in colicin uptake